ncbi:hypothetical protein CBM2634_B80010 [Cupriavidus taiwanensis]|uniref:Uncharacterized protein n=1 Tax=Cupriavidus taiwanensis TaxID=164546 RepID=A0A375JD42_9BURK|nr:hypothetical protein CBM2634_B80010 [Cupriavidus taiwanensis]
MRRSVTCVPRPAVQLSVTPPRAKPWRSMLPPSGFIICSQSIGDNLTFANEVSMLCFTAS